MGINEGYLYIIDRFHPMSDSNNRIYVHRAEMSLKLNRILRRNEVVHHKDGNKLNNSWENLEVLSNSDHAKLHKGGSKLKEVKCLCCKKIFTPKNKKRKFCSMDCFRLFSRKVADRPSNEIILKDINILGYKGVGRKYGVSDNCIRKWMRER